ncbi:virulence factor SrfB [Scandinavium sp. H11S7]|uniref:Virulence factor SrfB n=1 Tax=Scandinavium hiltneri TaxID=2926519 RepID=A0ABT2DXW9_9ENTR|nr:virulence factor SrfB [Scandinavium hiltneri]MCS2160478.1 virulence factor SrfB [Scandinavium hiltneri]
MLVTLCDYQQSITLIANSGVQFLDFGLTPQDSLSNGRYDANTVVPLTFRKVGAR